MSRLQGTLGAVYGFLAVALGAFAAHALRDSMGTQALEWIETGARYQLVHAVLLVAGALAGHTVSSRSLRAAGWLFVFGVIVFSGSLYAMAFTGFRALGAITPIGGVSLLAGWLVLTLALYRSRRTSYS